MLRLTENEMKTLSSLKQSSSFYKLTDLLKKEQAIGIKGLMKSLDASRIHQLQGRLQLLDELLIALQA